MAYVGQAYSECYERKWRNRDPERLWVGWNWAAFFFVDAWLLYRKMYLEFIIYIGVMLAIAFMFALLGARPGGLLLRLSLSMLADCLYQRKTYRAIRKQMREQIYDEDIVPALIRRGRINMILAYIYLAIVILYAGTTVWLMIAA